MAVTIGELTAAVTLLDEYLMEIEEDNVDNYRTTLGEILIYIVESERLRKKLDEVRAYALVMSLVF